MKITLKYKTRVQIALRTKKTSTTCDQIHVVCFFETARCIYFVTSGRQVVFSFVASDSAWFAVLTGSDLFLLSERVDILPKGDVEAASNRPGQGREVVRASRLPSLEQKVLFCRCGSTSIYVRGFCQRCYHRERADRKHFAGLREQVLARDGHRCRGCQAAAVESVLSVHHRRPGRSSLELLVTLCPACHALIERTQVLFRDVPELLRVLWRERHPAASEQMSLFAL